ncbi:MAG: hypothetical protein NTW03_01920 [Verrucomicrobia bacterium]|nr:hypothetical protein [Verrucomicrobiota bacterium]
MRDKKLDQIVLQMETYLECWKQLSSFMNLARAKEFGQEDETQFLELKSLITQQLEVILASLEDLPLSRKDIHGVITNAVSIRSLSQLDEQAMRSVENQWHKIFISLQSVLGQLKIKQKELEERSWWASLWGRKK